MHPVELLERIVDRSVPWLILVLVSLIVLEFFVDPTSPFGVFIDVFDWFVIVVLAFDLGFKFRRLVRPIGRMPRFSKAAHFYLHPDERGAS